jgi:hypothetical protein
MVYVGRDLLVLVLMHTFGGFFWQQQNDPWGPRSGKALELGWLEIAPPGLLVVGLPSDNLRARTGWSGLQKAMSIGVNEGIPLRLTSTSSIHS